MMTSASLLTPLRKRREFLTATKQGLRYATPAFIVQLVARGARTKPAEIGFGLTASKKIGNAVARNRARRRLRAMVHHVLGQNGQAAYYYVFVARAKILTHNYAQMCADAEAALKKLHTKVATDNPRDMGYT